MMALILIKRIEQYEYGTIPKGFVSHFSLGNNKYPKTTTTAADAL